jgi:glycosyltransferase involved in cell wall biosynthesis
MINVVSKAYCRHYQSGPKKVVDNLLKGLDKIGYPYVVNRRLDATKRLWIHDDVEALAQAALLPDSVKVVVGPNLVVMPRNLPANIDMSRFVYIHPSNWAKKFWEDAGFVSCPIVAWPTGIDTDEFAPSSGLKRTVLVYFKQRFPEELTAVEQALQKKGIAYQIVRYPTYRERVYKRLLREARYIVWVGRQESQGIALQEALAANVPLLLWDVTHMGQWQANKREMDVFSAEQNAHWATAAEYFDHTCGVRIFLETELAGALDRMEQQYSGFAPRKYIESHLSLEKQARDFVEIYNTYFGLSFDAGKTEQLLNNGDWLNRSMKNQVMFLAKDVAKSAIRFAKQRKFI